MTFKTVQWVRSVRDKHYEETKEMSSEQRAAYHKQKSESLRLKLKRLKHKESH